MGCLTDADLEAFAGQAPVTFAGVRIGIEAEAIANGVESKIPLRTKGKSHREGT